MSLISNKKWLSKTAKAISNSPYTYILLLCLIIAQFILILYLFFNIKSISINSNSLGQMNAKIDQIASEQKIISEKINGLQSIMLLVQSQLYRK